MTFWNFMIRRPDDSSKWKCVFSTGNIYSSFETYNLVDVDDVHVSLSCYQTQNDDLHDISKGELHNEDDKIS